MMGPPPQHMGYSPMGMHPVTPAYNMPHSVKPLAVRSSSKRKTMAHQQVHVTPRTPAVRLGFDASSSKKKRKLRPGAKEQAFPYFGRLPEQPKTTALSIFSFLSNDDLYNAGLVCKRWSRLAMDEELW
eukprot:CAMPEP_0116867864 /NCGR_PEP_ID=MMETSP0418-20121206/26861_1 /TAXON_ID=1158023 /ORGANISM="Astrosyne radiata, Strain 13vi08-1A" /LENGTH=127 /DNA_ID=CAMNT_0004503737 /DNA_START=214 /DNA_END=594 /DNA_ORIENTATION=-